MINKIDLSINDKHWPNIYNTINFLDNLFLWPLNSSWILNWPGGHRPLKFQVGDHKSDQMARLVTIKIKPTNISILFWKQFFNVINKFTIKAWLKKYLEQKVMQITTNVPVGPVSCSEGQFVSILTGPPGQYNWRSKVWRCSRDMSLGYWGYITG